jgi:hypothetical protein
MKNIHLLPTEKPSRLYKSKITQNISMGPIDISQHGDATYNLIIYITSDEEIKEGWILVNGFILRQVHYIDGYMVIDTTGGKHHNSVCKKIILTTDQDLINDGVQDIDDEFLEWFVKNPSCEFVEIRKYHSGILSDISEITSFLKIIIPQEKPKQETLKDAAERYSEGKSSNFSFRNTHIRDFIAGAKWQAERMYSEEELKNAIEISVAKALGVMSFTINEESFEQFKKK